MKDASASKQKFWDLLDGSRNEMRQAQTELERNNAVFFWERYEDALRKFSQALPMVDVLGKAATDYYTALGDRTHTFGVFPVSISDLAWCNDVGGEIRHLRRIGTDRGGDFANVWEARKIQNEVRDLRGTLEEASRRIEEDLSKTMRRFERAVSDEVARKVIEEIRRLERP